MSDVCIKIFPTRAEAEIARTLLLEEDIECSIVCDDAGGTTTTIPSCSSFCLLVTHDDKERAIHLLRSIGGQGLKKNHE